MAFTYRDMGCTFHDHILRIFCIGWMDCSDAFHAVLCLYCNGQNKAEYEEYWLMGVPIINLWGARQPFILVQRYAQINQLKLLCYRNKYKENFVI